MLCRLVLRGAPVLLERGCCSSRLTNFGTSRHRRGWQLRLYFSAVVSSQRLPVGRQQRRAYQLRGHQGRLAQAAGTRQQGQLADAQHRVGARLTPRRLRGRDRATVPAPARGAGKLRHLWAQEPTNEVAPAGVPGPAVWAPVAGRGGRRILTVQGSNRFDSGSIFSALRGPYRAA